MVYVYTAAYLMVGFVWGVIVNWLCDEEYVSVLTVILWPIAMVVTFVIGMYLVTAASIQQATKKLRERFHV